MNIFTNALVILTNENNFCYFVIQNNIFLDSHLTLNQPFIAVFQCCISWGYFVFSIHYSDMPYN